MAELKPYTGEVITDSPEEQPSLTPYMGEVVPLASAPEETASSSPGILKQIGGASQALLEFGAAIPGAIVGTGLAAGHTLAGEDPRIALEGLKGVMEETNLAKKALPEKVLKELQSTYGYKLGSAPAEAIGLVFEGLGKIGGWASALMGAEKDTAEKTDAYTQLIAMSLGLGAGAKGKFKGSQKEYFELHDKILKGTPEWDAVSAKNREDYPTAKPYEGEVIPLDQPKDAHALDTGQFPESLSQSPYNLPEALKRQIEEEHNPTNAPEVRQEGQGELFTGREALTPDEAIARRFVTEDGTSLRNRPEDIVISGDRGYEPLGGATEMSNRPTAEKMEIQYGRRPEEGIPFESQPRSGDPLKAGEHLPVTAEAGKQIPALGDEIRSKPGFLRSAEEVLNERLSRVPHGQRGFLAFGELFSGLQVLVDRYRAQKKRIQDAAEHKRFFNEEVRAVGFDRAMQRQGDRITKSSKKLHEQAEKTFAAIEESKRKIEEFHQDMIKPGGRLDQYFAEIDKEVADRMSSQLKTAIESGREPDYSKHKKGAAPTKPLKIWNTWEHPKGGLNYNLLEYFKITPESEWLKLNDTPAFKKKGVKPLTLEKIKADLIVHDEFQKRSNEMMAEADAARKLRKVPPKQRGMAVIPFGKSAEALREGFVEKAKELMASLDRIGEAFKKGQIQPNTYYKRREELVREMSDLKKRNDAATDAAYKQENPEYVGRPGDLTQTLGTMAERPSGQVLPFVPKGQRGHIGDWDKRIAKQGLTKTMLDMKREIAIEKRRLPEIIEAGELDPKRIQDIAPESEGKILSMLKRGASHLLIDRTMARLSRERPGSGTLIKWETDQRAAIDNRKDISVRDALIEGLLHFKRAKTSDVRQMLDIWQDAVGKAPLTRESFKSEHQWQWFQKTKGVYDKIHSDVNKAREAAGRTPLPYIENYLPAIWEGDYRVWVYDQAGNKVGAFGLKTEYGAKKTAAEFRKQHPELDVREPEHVPEREQFHDLTAFEEAIKIHQGDFAATRALQQTYTRLLRTKGMGAHGLLRQGIFGFLGMEPGKVGVKNFQRALEVYTKRAYNHIANLEKNDLAQQLDQLPKKIKDKIPNTIDYLHQALNLAKGVDIAWTNKFPDAAFEELGYATGLGRSIAKRAISEVASIGSIAMLATVKFLAVQPLQYLNTIPKLVQLRGRIPDANTMTMSMLRGLQGMLIPETRDATQVKAMAWANKNEHLQAALVDMAGLRATDPSVSFGSRMGNVARFTLGSVEKHTVRTPSFLAFEYALRDITKDDATRFEQAAALMGYEMVTYDAASTPRIYSELGLLGDAAKPLKQYSHNTWGRFFEYVQGAKNHMEFAPLAAYIGTQLGVGGIRGIVGIAEATLAITLINSLFGQDIPTPEQLWIKHGPANNKVANAVLFGLPSALTGWDVSGTVTAPTVPQMFGVFPVAIAGKAFIDSANLIIKYLQGTHTDADVLKALQSTSPSAMREFWTERFSEPGQPAPKASMDMQGTYVRDPIEKTVAWLTGLKSISEARADEVMRQFKQMILRDESQKITAIRAITDRAVSGKEIPSSLIEKHIAEGGDPRKLGEAIKQELIRRQMPWMDRQLIGKEMTPNKAHKLEIMRQELDREFERRQIEGKDPTDLHKMQQRAPTPDMRDSQLEFNQAFLGSSGPERLKLREEARRRGIRLPTDEQIEEDERIRRKSVRDRARRKLRTGTYVRDNVI